MFTIISTITIKLIVVEGLLFSLSLSLGIGLFSLVSWLRSGNGSSLDLTSALLSPITLRFLKEAFLAIFIEGDRFLAVF